MLSKTNFTRSKKGGDLLKNSLDLKPMFLNVQIRRKEDVKENSNSSGSVICFDSTDGILYSYNGIYNG